MRTDLEIGFISLQWTKVNKMQEHLIIDGNNALHAIPELKREMGRDRNQARDSLLRLLEPLQSFEGCMMTVVFDGRGGPQSVSKHRGIEEFTIVFSSSAQGADGVIERMLMAAKQPERIVVITNDGLIRNCAYAHQATAMRVEEAFKRLDHSIETSLSIREKTERTPNAGKKFENRIPFSK
jgi:predicted RNA-binding protein with PIN domain